MNIESAHRVGLIANGIPAACIEPLTSYLDLVASWARRTNLTAARTPEARVQILVTPVLAGVDWICGTELLDVGSGNGSPGLVMALLAPQLRVVLLEPRLKRWAFLREACRVLGRPDIQVRRERLEQYTGSTSDHITLRALSLPAHLVERWLRPAGRILVWGAPLPGVSEANLRLVHGSTMPLAYEHVSRETFDR